MIFSRAICSYPLMVLLLFSALRTSADNAANNKSNGCIGVAVLKEGADLYHHAVGGPISFRVSLSYRNRPCQQLNQQRIRFSSL